MSVCICATLSPHPFPHPLLCRLRPLLFEEHVQLRAAALRTCRHLISDSKWVSVANPIVNICCCCCRLLLATADKSRSNCDDSATAASANLLATMGLPLFVSMSLEAHVHRQFESERNQAMGVRMHLLVCLCHCLSPLVIHVPLCRENQPVLFQVARQLIRMKADGLKGVGTP